MNILITAGGTREYIDPVRFISNASTGKMGYALAKAAQDANHNVTLITTPTSLEIPKGIRHINVITSEEMFKAVQENLAETDCLIMAAAVSDYRVAKISETKIKKTSQKLTLELEPTTDIIAWAGKNKKKGQVLVGFALEDTNMLKNAEDKMIRKNMDMIIANSPTAISANESIVNIKTTIGKWIQLPLSEKSEIAKKIIEMVQSLFKY